MTRRTRFFLVVPLLVCFLACLARAQSGSMQSLDSIFKSANDQAKRGDCASAIKAYERLAQSYRNNPDVHVNLAHCWLQSAQKGRAIWQLELAHQLVPTDASIVQNVRQLQEDLAQQRVEREGEVDVATAPVLHAWSAYVPANATAIVFLISSWSALALGLLIMRQRGKFARLLRAGLLISVLSAIGFSALLLLRYRWLEHHPIAIALDDQLTLYSGPDPKSQPGAALHEGEYLRLIDEYEAWLRVENASAQQGWVERQHLGVIQD